MSRWASTREAKDTSMEAKLRQLYLQVHPDLFSSFPAARKENEKSFQVLSEFLEIMKGGSPVRTKTFALKFYIKPDVEHELKESDLKLLSTRLMANGSPSDVKELNKLFELFGLGRFTGSNKIEKNVFLVSELEEFVRTYGEEAQEILKAHQDTWSNVYTLQHSLHLQHNLRVAFPKGTDASTQTRVLEQLSDGKILRLVTNFDEKYRKFIISRENSIQVDGRISLCCDETADDWHSYLSTIDWPQVAKGERFVMEMRDKEKRAAESLGVRFVHATADLEFSDAYLTLLDEILRVAGDGRRTGGRRRKDSRTCTVSLLVTDGIPTHTDIEQLDGGCGIMKSKGALYASVHSGAVDILDFVAAHVSAAHRYKVRLEEQRESLHDMLQQARMALGLRTLEVDRSQVSAEEAILCCSKLLELASSPTASNLAGLMQGIRFKIGRTYALGEDGTLILPYDLKAGDDTPPSPSSSSQQ